VCCGCDGGCRQISDGIISLGVEATVAVVGAAGGCISMAAEGALAGEGMHRPIHRQEEEEGLRIRQPVTKLWQESFWENYSAHNVNRNQYYIHPY
jgi:predicted amino acid dehydrogenase